MKISKKDKAKKKFLKIFKKGFYDSKFDDWERSYKWEAHQAWKKELNREKFEELMERERYHEISKKILQIESRTNLLFSFEKMAIRDAIKEDFGAEVFANAIYSYVYGQSALPERFNKFIQNIEILPRIQTRVLTWPVVTVFGFIANPKEHIFLKPLITKKAAEVYGYDFDYRARPNWDTYFSLIDFANTVKKDLKSLKPRDYIDIQSFIFVLGSPYYD